MRVDCKLFTCLALAALAVELLAQSPTGLENGRGKGLNKPRPNDHANGKGKGLLKNHEPSGQCQTSTEPIGTEYSAVPSSQFRTIAGLCVADLGTCDIGSCRYDLTRNEFCPDDGYICPETSTVEIDCGIPLGVFSVEQTTSCKCCQHTGITIYGKVSESVDNLPLGNIRIIFAGSLLTITDADGLFSFSVPPSSSTVSFIAINPDGGYIQTVKIVDIPPGLPVVSGVEVVLVPKANPVTIDATIENSLRLFSDAAITIPADSFTDQDGNIYTGLVKASITIIDVTDDGAEGIIPGRLQTTDENGIQQDLISYGMFAVEFTDENGNMLDVGSIRVSVPEEMFLWTLGDDGFWNLIETRRKRQVTLDDFLVRLPLSRWVNIDKIPGSPFCHFKARIFDDMGTEIETSTTTTFRPGVLTFTPAPINGRLRIYLGSTQSPSTTCFTVRCSFVNNNLVGTVNMTSYETVLIGGVSVPISMQLKGKLKADYIATIQAAHTTIGYSLTNNDFDIFANFISDANGPFYTDKDACEASTVDDPAFHFIKEPLPSYLPVPGSINICTLRFMMYFFSPINAINVSAVSTWTEDGSDYYYTDTSLLMPTAINDTTFSVCLQYRCSEAGEPTTILVVADFSSVSNSSGQNFSGESGWSATCYSSCQADDCSSSSTNNALTFTTEAPIDTTSQEGIYGPDEESTCSEDLPDEPVSPLGVSCYVSNRNFARQKRRALRRIFDLF